jgi:hypothetical protein
VQAGSRDVEVPSQQLCPKSLDFSEKYLILNGGLVGGIVADYFL